MKRSYYYRLNVVSVQDYLTNFIACLTKIILFKELEAGLMKYKPDIIINVHPLMHHCTLLDLLEIPQLVDVFEKVVNYHMLN